MCDLELQQYLFDLQGYLVIEDALSANELAQLNELIDRQDLLIPEKQLRFGGVGGGGAGGAGFFGVGKTIL